MSVDKAIFRKIRTARNVLRSQFIKEYVSNKVTSLVLPQPIRIIILSPHMDDDILGCGGLIAQIAEQHSYDLTIVYLTDGRRGTVDLRPISDLIDLRRTEAKQSVALLGAEKAELIFLNKEDMALSCDQETVNQVASVIERKKPGWIFVASPLDNHPDHKTACSILRKALGCIPSKCQPKEILLYEVYSTLPINRFLDITAYARKKEEAMKKHASQIILVPYHEYILGLNRFRGMTIAKPGDSVVHYGEGYLALKVSQFRAFARRANY
jgi:LmbE family N-acetylglucosaminyl deacetylase